MMNRVNVLSKRRVIVLAIALALMAPLPAQAHQPVVLLDAETTAARGPLLVDGTISFAVRAAFTKAGQKKGFRATLQAGDQFAVQYLIVDQKPENALRTSQLPLLVVTSPSGKKISITLNERTKFFEPYGATNYFYLARYTAIAEAGTYNFLLTSRAKSAITLAVGEREVPGEVVRAGDPSASPTPTPKPSSSAKPTVSPSQSPTASPESTTTKGYTLKQVAVNDNAASCWSAIDGFVYDLTRWISSHPGGAARILSLCGIDGTSRFMAQHAGQNNPTARLSTFLLGPLIK